MKYKLLSIIAILAISISNAATVPSFSVSFGEVKKQREALKVQAAKVAKVGKEHVEAIQTSEAKRKEIKRLEEELEKLLKLYDLKTLAVEQGLVRSKDINKLAYEKEQALHSLKFEIEKLAKAIKAIPTLKRKLPSAQKKKKRLKQLEDEERRGRRDYIDVVVEFKKIGDENGKKLEEIKEIQTNIIEINVKLKAALDQLKD